MKAVVVCAMVALLGGVARAEEFDPTGWKLLGSAGADDTVTLKVRSYLGDLHELAVVMLNGSSRLVSVKVNDNQAGAVGVDLDEDHPTMLLTHDGAAIQTIDVELDDIHGRARFAVFGRVQANSDAAANTTTWDHAGWVELGTTKSLRGYLMFLRPERSDAMSKIAMVPTADLDVSLLGADLAEQSGTARVDEIATTLWRAGEAHIIDLSAQPTLVGLRQLMFSYVVNGALSAKVAVYGLPAVTAVAARAAATTSAFSPEGWTLLGEDEVDLVDDEIEISRRKSTWRQVALVVTGDAVDVKTVDLHLAGKASKVQHEDVEQAYEGGSTRVIDITGKRRAIQKVKLSYRKHRLDAATTVKVYAR